VEAVAAGTDRLVKKVRSEASDFAGVISTLGLGGTDSEVEESIQRLRVLLSQMDSGPPTKDERTETIWIGRLYKKNNNFSEAIKWFDRFLKRKDASGERDKDYADVLYNKACYLSLNGQLDDALRCLGESISLSPINKQDARGDSDFDPLRREPRLADAFNALVREDTSGNA
jgi:tetratricopeptide (TPR) repeat protein